MTVLINTQPQDITAQVGDIIFFTFGYTVDTVFSGYKVSIQWYKNNSPISAATSSILKYGPISSSDDNASFYAVVTAETLGSATTAKAYLTISNATSEPIPAPEIPDTLPEIWNSPIRLYAPYNAYFPQHIKVFVPPGCVSFILGAVQQSSFKGVVVLRFKQPISQNYATYVAGLTNTEYNNLLPISLTGVTLSSLISEDVLYSYGTETYQSPPLIYDYSSNASDSDISNIASTGSWLYISVYPVSGLHPGLLLKYSFHCVRFLTWYNSVLWSSTGDPSMDQATSETVIAGAISFSPQIIGFNNVPFNTRVIRTLTLTSTYTDNIDVTISTNFTEVEFSETDVFTLSPSVPYDVTLTYTAKTLGTFTNYFNVAVQGSTAFINGKIYTECLPTVATSKITADTSRIIFPVIEPTETTEDKIITVTSEYDTECDLSVTNIPSGVAVDPTTQNIDNTISKAITCSYTYDIDHSIDQNIYLTSTDHAEVSVPINIIGICTSASEDLVIIQSVLDFGEVILGEEEVRHFTLCSRFSDEITITYSCSSEDIKIEESVSTLNFNDIIVINVTYTPKVENTNINSITITIKYLDKSIELQLKGNCPTYEQPVNSSFLLVDALDFRTAEINQEYTGVTAIVHDKGYTTSGEITYPEGFSGPATVTDIESGVPKEITVTFAPTEEKLYSGNIIVKEVEQV